MDQDYHATRWEHLFVMGEDTSITTTTIITENMTAWDRLVRDDCWYNSDSSGSSSSKTSRGTLSSFFFSPKNVDSFVIGVEEDARKKRRQGQVDKAEQNEEEEEQELRAAEEQHRRESCNRTSNKQGSNTDQIISSCSTSASTKSNVHASSYCPPLNSRVEDDSVLVLEETSHLRYPPPAHSTTRSGTTNSAVFSGSYPSSSFARNSSSSQKPPSPFQEDRGRVRRAKKKRKIVEPCSTMQVLRSCAKYVARVKTSLLNSNHEDKYNAFIDLLCNWSDLGLSSQEVFSQMQLILQDVSPELLAAFTAFIPVDDKQEEARLHLEALSIRAQEDTAGIEGASSTYAATRNVF